MKLQSFLKKTLWVATSAILLNPVVVLSQSAREFLTNSDVLKLIKAGIPEETIILSVQNSPANFDTSPEALIELRQQGVSQQIMNAMLAPKQSPDVTKVGTHQDSQGNAVSIALSSVKLIADEQEHIMKRRKPNVQITSGSRLLAPWVAPSKQKAVISGSRSNLRISDHSPTFEMSLPSDISPNDYIVLVKLDSKKDRREVQTGRAGGGGLKEFFGAGVRVKQGIREKTKVNLVYEELQSSSSVGLTTYRAKVNSPLAAGEYGLVYQDFFYDFGLDL
ncbi:hypothetical protein C1752_01409 [Acaryochloris thomasi RCC1774]|uniref:Uncharacterized protein n=1 Tax=Acaryochloris thomasi RCC1774 TaxID=1764569 RepID=A0A2W1JLQ6_9CYAN|nr:hypothetical protein [Acaryochloris thomasi]PZD74258.1 hypothetical protein C1752_01409 [Acaryochloris thomasi RCC1774]